MGSATIRQKNSRLGLPTTAQNSCLQLNSLKVIGLFEIILGILSVAVHGVMIFQYNTLKIDTTLDKIEIKPNTVSNLGLLCVCHILYMPHAHIFVITVMFYLDNGKSITIKKSGK